MSVTRLGTEARLAIDPLSPSFLKLSAVLNAPSTPIKLTDVEPVTPVSTTP